MGFLGKVGKFLGGVVTGYVNAVVSVVKFVGVSANPILVQYRLGKTLVTEKPSLEALANEFKGDIDNLAEATVAAGNMYTPADVVNTWAAQSSFGKAVTEQFGSIGGGQVDRYVSYKTTQYDYLTGKEVEQDRLLAAARDGTILAASVAAGSLAGAAAAGAASQAGATGLTSSAIGVSTAATTAKTIDTGEFSLPSFAKNALAVAGVDTGFYDEFKKVTDQFKIPEPSPAPKTPIVDIYNPSIIAGNDGIRPSAPIYNVSSPINPIIPIAVVAGIVLLLRRK